MITNLVFDLQLFRESRNSSTVHIKKSQLKTKINNNIVVLHPETETAQVKGLTDTYYDKTEINDKLSKKQDNITISNTVSNDKNNPISPYGVYEELKKYSTIIDTDNKLKSYYNKNEVDTELNKKQNILTIDGVPTDNSNNPVSSTGVYNALLSKVNKSDMSNYVTQTEMNSKLNEKQDTLVFDDDIKEGSKDIVTSGVIYTNINKLNTKIDNIHIPTKVSELENDSKYLTTHQDISGKQDKLTFDDEPTNNSDNPVKSKGIKKYVDTKVSTELTSTSGNINEKINEVKKSITEITDNKQDKLTFDDIPTDNSDNPVKSKGIKKYIDDSVDKVKITKDTVPKENSNNPITSGAVYNVMINKLDKSALDIYAKKSEVMDSINKKMNITPIDSEVKQDSLSLITSGAVYAYVKTVSNSAVSNNAQIKNINEKIKTIESNIDTNTKTIDTNNKAIVKSLDEYKKSNNTEILNIKNNYTTNDNLSKSISTLKTEISTSISDASTNIIKKIPTKVSELENDSKYLTTHQDLSGKQDKLTFDDEPIDNSDNPVKSKGIKKYVDTKVSTINSDLSDKLNTDISKVNNSINTITSNLSLKQNKLVFDSSPTFGSKNVVTSTGVKEYIDSQINSIPKFKIEVVTSLPSYPSSTTIYLLKDNSSEDDGNMYDEYIYVNNKWEQLGSQKINLSGYATVDSVEQLKASKQDKLTFDDKPTDNSGNMVSSGSIYDALINKSDKSDLDKYTTLVHFNSKIDEKQDKLAFDADIKANSSNMVTSGIIYNHINEINNKIKSIPTKVSELENDKGYLTMHQDVSNKQDRLIFDDIPKDDSDNPVKSKGIKKYVNDNILSLESKISGKQDKLVFDDEPTDNSDNPVKSKGIKKYIKDNIKSTISVEVESVPTINSKKLITSGGVYNALLGKVNKNDLDDYTKISSMKEYIKSITDKSVTQSSDNLITSGAVYDYTHGVFEEVANLSLTAIREDRIFDGFDWPLIMPADPNHYKDDNIGNVIYKVFNKPSEYDKKLLRIKDAAYIWCNLNNNVYYRYSQLKTKIDAIHIPTKVSELDNDKKYLTTHQDISGKQDKLTFDDEPTNNSDNPVKSKGIKKYVDTQISSIPKFKIEVVTSLPSNPSSTTIYLVKNSSAQSNSGNMYDEYIYVNNKWEQLGSQKIDLSGYATISSVDKLKTSKQDKLTFDDEPTNNSGNPVKSGGIKKYIDDIVDVITNEVDNTLRNNLDDEPTDHSINPVKSKGIKKYVDTEIGKNKKYIDDSINKTYTKTEIDNKLNGKLNIKIDTAITKGSNNPIASGAVYDKFNDLTNTVNNIKDTYVVSDRVHDEYFRDMVDLNLNYLNSNFIPTFQSMVTSLNSYKKLIDNDFNGKISEINNKISNISTSAKVPTKVSELENDKGYLTTHQDISGKVDKIDLKPISKDDISNIIYKKLEIKGITDKAPTDYHLTYTPKLQEKANGFGVKMLVDTNNNYMVIDFKDMSVNGYCDSRKYTDIDMTTGMNTIQELLLLTPGYIKTGLGDITHEKIINNSVVKDVDLTYLIHRYTDKDSNGKYHCALYVGSNSNIIMVKMYDEYKVIMEFKTIDSNDLIKYMDKK